MQRQAEQEGRGKSRRRGFPDKIMEPASVLQELARIAEQKLPISNERFFELVKAFVREKREHNDAVMEMEKAINEAYGRFPLEQREKFLAMLYDEFAGLYDGHMSVTGHYDAIRDLLFFAGPHLRTPLLDITAGTGEPLKYVIDYIRTAEMIRTSKDMAGRFDFLLSVLPEGTAGIWEFCANEISPQMLVKAMGKHMDNRVNFTSKSAYEVGDDYEGGFNTVLCCQTFHMIPDEEKAKLVISINKALAPGGVAVVIEEDPFIVTPTEYIEPVSLFIRSVAAPIKHKGKLEGLFSVNGFRKMEDRAVSPIDTEHSMRLHLFMKSEVRP